MDDRNGASHEPLLQSKIEECIHQEHTITLADGVTRSVSRRDDTISFTSEWVLKELRNQMYIAGPMVSVTLLQYLLMVVSLMFIGHLGELQLASAAIAGSFAGVSGTSLLQGMACALETLCGQAYGSKQYHMLGIYMQRAMLVLFVVSLPIAIVWWNTGSILVVLGQDPEISAGAGVYARFLLPFLFGVVVLQPLVKFLQTQSEVLAMALFSAATLILHVPLCWVLIYKLGLGYRGAALASGISCWLNTLLLASYVKFSPRFRRTWTSFSRESFNDLPAFFKLAVPSALMMCLEYWSFQGLVLMSGLLPNPKLETATLSLCLTGTALLYMIPFGIGAAASTRVSNELGAGRPQAAKGSVIIAVLLGVTEGLIMATALYLGRYTWSKAFTNENEVIEYVGRVSPLLAIMHVMDATQGVLSGVARGCGWLAFGAAANLLAYYFVGLPTAVVLAFVFKLGGRGLWCGLIMGVTTQALSLLVITCITNWQQQADQALLRVYSSVTATLPTEANKEQKDEIPALLLLNDGVHEEVR
uniref:Protein DETOXIFICATION n=1 Tax=Physcomitrium patens TaxID=3218 RepID=A0A2K1LBB3_PHYPA|nr:hypothetical protein PHYPA_001745 [Physcomitrium patens]